MKFIGKLILTIGCLIMIASMVSAVVDSKSDRYLIGMIISCAVFLVGMCISGGGQKGQ